MKHYYNFIQKLSVKFFAKSLFLCAILIASFTSKASIINYTFSFSSGTYSPITGTTLYTGTWDDASSSLITIPFTFNYNSVSYTTLGINTNGFITLGAVPATTYCGLQTSALNSIAGYGTDLVNGSATSTISYTTL